MAAKNLVNALDIPASIFAVEQAAQLHPWDGLHIPLSFTPFWCTHDTAVFG